MAVWTFVARQAAIVTRLCTPKSAAANLVRRRGLSTGGDHLSPRKSNLSVYPSDWFENIVPLVQGGGPNKGNVAAASGGGPKR
ncbi:hypothetical protein OROHE_000456 [Orobanche hederae]